MFHPFYSELHSEKHLNKLIAIMTKTLKTMAAVAGVSLLSTVASHAAVYSQNFDSFPNGTTNLGDGTSINSATPGNASVQGGQLRLTNDAIGSENGSFIIPAMPGASLGWTASFDITIIDAAGENQPADGASFNWGALTGSLSGNTQGAEHGWTNSDVQINYQVDTWMNGATDNGLRIATHLTGTENVLAAQQGSILNDGGAVTGTVILSWSPVNGASMSTSDLVTNVNFANVAVPGFTGNESFLWAFAARTGGADQTLLIDNLVITTVPEASTSLLAGLGLMMVRRRK